MNAAQNDVAVRSQVNGHREMSNKNIIYYSLFTESGICSLVRYPNDNPISVFMGK